MNPIMFVMRRPVTTLMVLVALVGGGFLGLSKMRPDIVPPLNSPKMNVYLADIGTSAKRIKDYIVNQYESYFHKQDEETHHEERKIVVTSPTVMEVVITQPYVCQIHSRRHIDVCALESGYLEAITVKEGQAVKEGDVLFKVIPILYKARWDAEIAEAMVAQLKFDNTKRLFDDPNKVVSENEVLLFKAELAKAVAKRELAKAEYDFASIKAPFDGIIDRLREQQGSLIKEGDILTTLSDNSVMWVYFNMPEKQYLEYMGALEQHQREDRIELKLASQEIFPYPGKIDLSKGIGAIEAKFNNETGNIAFRADFPNPKRLLRHGQTGTILIHRTLHNAIVIPQRATFERLDKRYVWVVGEDEKAQQRLITIQHELEDIFVINSGLKAGEKIVLDGVRQIEEGAKVEYEFRKPEEALKNQKFRAE